jgi:hypothetical protein
MNRTHLTAHALMRMEERAISNQDVFRAMEKGKCTRLKYNTFKWETKATVVIASKKDNVIITTYNPPDASTPKWRAPKHSPVKKYTGTMRAKNSLFSPAFYQ